MSRGRYLSLPPDTKMNNVLDKFIIFSYTRKSRGLFINLVLNLVNCFVLTALVILVIVLPYRE